MRIGDATLTLVHERCGERTRPVLTARPLRRADQADEMTYER